MRRLLLLFLATICFLPICSRADWGFRSTDSLAPRDEYGLLHQGREVEQTDFAPRYSCRSEYYFVSSRTLTGDPAYVAALQTALFHRGYYCGPMDGNFSFEVSAAVARMQKNFSQRVTGTLTVAVRRGLHLP
ncbi:MAG: peptidoglycan-binding domain-containing protein [Chthoniobacterales bacterium]